MEANKGPKMRKDSETNRERREQKSFHGITKAKHKKQTSDNANKSGNTAETDDLILKRREKQVEYGKNTLAYDRYSKTIPKQERTKDMPKTPNKHVQYSRRQWDGLIKHWRRAIHKYDPEGGKENEEEEGKNNDSTVSWADEVEEEELNRSLRSSMSIEETGGTSSMGGTSVEGFRPRSASMGSQSTDPGLGGSCSAASLSRNGSESMLFAGDEEVDQVKDELDLEEEIEFLDV